ncbi:hypothetical protein [Acuticoccus sp.]|uniref:hypothetical protein n=1 Tax=Acuticoccus sp. TaxID=1904378 RepID=UPI003B51DC7E
MTRTIAALLTLALLTAPTAAQDAVTEDDARGFFDGPAEDANELVRDGTYQGAVAWLEGRLAPEASFAIAGSVHTARGLAVTYQAALGREQLTGLAATSTSPLAVGTQIWDFTLTSDVRRVTPLPDGEAAAVVTLTETGTLSTAGAAALSATFHSVADCTMRLGRANGSVVIEVAACEQVTMF